MLGLDMKRIDPEVVAAWFREHPGVEPLRGRFACLTPDDAGVPVLTGCCGLSGLVADRPGGDRLVRALSRASWHPAAVHGDPFARIGLALGLDGDYVRGWICGWDGVAPLADLDADAEMSAICTGHSDGRDAWEATIGPT